MAIELDTSRVASQIATNLEADSAATGASAAQKLTALLGGDSLTVSDGSFTDLEALVARLKNDQDKTKFSLFLSSLNAIGDSLTDAQKRQLAEGVKLSEELKNLKGQLSEQTKALGGAETQSVILQAKIDSLTKQIEQAVKDGKDHNELVRKQNELKKELAANKEQIEGLKKDINETKNAISDVSAKMDSLVKYVGENTLKTIAQEFSQAFDEKPETNAEEEKKEKKAEDTNVFNSIRDSLDKFEDRLQERIEESRPHMV